MCTNLGAWALAILIIKITEPAGAMKWCNEEQFVDGEFPYYPYSNRIYSLTDGLTDDEALANEFSAVQPAKKQDMEAQKANKLPAGLDIRSQKASFYEFKKDSASVIDATKTESNETSPKPVESKKSLGLISRIAQKKSEKSTMKTKLDGAHRVPRSHWEREEVGEKPEIQIGFREQKAQFLEDGLNLKTAERLGDGVLQNVSSVVTLEGQSSAIRSNTDTQRVREVKRHKPENGPIKKPAQCSVKIHGPYENNYSGGGFRYTNPSTWLAREIEKFIRRNDYRWLDFMKNNGLGTNGIMVEAKHQPDEMGKYRKPRVMPVGCVRGKDCGKQGLHPTQETLLHQVDELLQDLSQFRANVKNDESGSKKTREVKKAWDVKLSNKGGNVRDTRSINLPNFRGKSERSKPYGHRVSPAIVENDLMDLKRNIVLYENNLPDEESRQALKDMRLHIKVYVENNGENCSREEK